MSGTRFPEQIEQIERAQTPEQLQAIVKANGGFDEGGIMRDPYAERAVILNGTRIYEAMGQPHAQARNSAEALFYPGTKPWPEPKPQIVPAPAAVVQIDTSGKVNPAVKLPKGTFDWVEFPKGRARFAGTFRCWDEQGRKTFALKIRGNEYFGEVKRSYLKNHNDYNVVVDSFGYGRGQDVGMPGVGDVDLVGVGVREVFSVEEDSIARESVVRLIRAGLEYDDPPTILDQTEASRFMGQVAFQNGWMLIAVDGDGAAQ